MNKVNQTFYNIHQQKAIQILKNLTKKYSDEKLINLLFSKSPNEEEEKEIYLIFDELKKNVSIEDLSSFLFHIINGETYDTIIFSSEIAEKKVDEALNKRDNLNGDTSKIYGPRVNNDIQTENSETNNEENNKNLYNINKNKNSGNIIRIKLNCESSEKDDNDTISNIENDNLQKGKKNVFGNKISNSKNFDSQNRKMLNKPIKKFGCNDNLDILNHENNTNNILEFITVNHKPQIEKYNKLLRKLINTNNLNVNELFSFTTLRKKSCKKIREDINGLSIIGKHYLKNNKGKVFFYKPICFKRMNKVKFICSEGEKCGSFGYFNLLTKKFVVKKEHKLEFENHKIYKVKDRFFVNKLSQNKEISDIQEYILLAKFE